MHNVMLLLSFTQQPWITCMIDDAQQEVLTGTFVQVGKTVVHMLGRRKWAETSGVTGIEWGDFARR